MLGQPPGTFSNRSGLCTRFIRVAAGSGDLTLYYVVLAIVAMALIARIVNSPFGQILLAIKDNEPRATSPGYDADRFKLIAFVLSASFSGLAGALKAMILGFVTLSDVHWSMSGSVILMTLVGGVGPPYSGRWPAQPLWSRSKIN